MLKVALAVLFLFTSIGPLAAQSLSETSCASHNIGEQISYFEGMTAHYQGTSQCQSPLKIVINFSEQIQYTGNALPLQKLLAGTRAALSFECPHTPSPIKVCGIYQGRSVLNFTIAESSGWRLPTLAGQNTKNPRKTKQYNKTRQSQQPHSTTTARNSTHPPSAQCDYNPHNPIVGCWHLVHPEASRGAILNIKNDGTWYDGVAEKLAINGEYLGGPSYKQFEQVGMGPYFEMNWSSGFNSSWSGPFFAVNCSVMELRPYTPTNIMMQLMGADGSNPTYRGIRLNTKYISENMFELQGPLASEMMLFSEAEQTFKGCRDNIDDTYGIAKLAITASIALLPVGKLTNFIPASRITSRYSPKFQILKAKPKSWKSPKTKIEPKIADQMRERGWTKNSLNKTVNNPYRKKDAIDTRWMSGGKRRSDPATAYIRKDGHYVVKNEIDGTIVQISDITNPMWVSPF